MLVCFVARFTAISQQVEQQRMRRPLPRPVKCGLSLITEHRFMKNNIEGAVVLSTGAGSGLGEATANTKKGVQHGNQKNWYATVQ
jgi:hypothetical protein